jgi:hypothetical protein
VASIGVCPSPFLQSLFQIKDLMQNAYQLDIPLKVDVGVVMQNNHIMTKVIKLKFLEILNSFQIIRFFEYAKRQYKYWMNMF